MHKQMSLWDRRQASIDQRFVDFDRSNPHVWTEFEAMALRLSRAGHKRYSADAILHVIRYDYDVRTLRASDSSDGFKINNDFSSRYARKFARQHPELSSFFEQRKLTA